MDAEEAASGYHYIIIQPIIEMNRAAKAESDQANILFV